MEEERKVQEFVCEEDPEIKDSAAARRIKALGEDEVNIHESKFHGKKIGRVENFWYQHRWHLGITVFFIIVATVAVLQIVTRVTPDACIMYAGPGTLVGAGYERFEAAIFEVLDDYSGDGKKELSVADSTYLNPKQAEEKMKLGYFDASENQAAYERYMVEITSREYMLCMLDPELFNEVKENGGFLSLKEIFGDEIPYGAYEEYGIRLGDTEFYKSRKSELFFLPEDTVLAVMTLPEKASEKKIEKQKQHMELLRAIAEYEAPKKEK